jgi:hypothetical protein
VLPKDGNGEDDQENIKAYDGDGSIYRRHGPDAMEDRAVLRILELLFLALCNQASACAEGNQDRNSPEIAEGRLHKNISIPI